MADLTITAANVVNVSCRVAHGTFGATVTAGQAVYIDTADGNSLKPADTNSGTAAARTFAGIALNGGGDGQAAAYATGDGLIDMGATLTVGEVYVLSANAGGIAPVGDLATGHYTCVLGVATAANRLKLMPIQGGVAKA